MIIAAQHHFTLYSGLSYDSSLPVAKDGNKESFLDNRSEKRLQFLLYELNMMLQNIILRDIYMKPNNFAMKEWHLEHVEKTIVRFSKGLSPDASSFEKRNYKKYGTISYCIKQIEYDMKHGVDKTEVMEVLRKIRLDEKYTHLREDAEAVGRLKALEDQLLTGGAQIQEKSLSWYNNAYKEKSRGW